MVLGLTENRSFCGTASHGLGPGGFFWFKMQRTNMVSGWTCGRQRFAPYCSQVCWDWRALQCFRSKHGHPNISALRSELCSSRDHTRPPKLSVALAMVLTMNARRFQRTPPPLRGMGDYYVKGYCSGSYCFCAHCESDPVNDARYSAVVG